MKKTTALALLLSLSLTTLVGSRLLNRRCTNVPTHNQLSPDHTRALLVFSQFRAPRLSLTSSLFLTGLFSLSFPRARDASDVSDDPEMSNSAGVRTSVRAADGEARATWTNVVVTRRRRRRRQRRQRG